MDCLNSGTESLACGMKEAIKLHVYNIRTAHVEKVRHDAMNTALAEALSKGLTTTIATKQAHKIGAKAAKLANRQANRILGPIIASGWDFFEAMYYGGDVIEAFLRGIATLFGTYLVGYHGQKALGRIGYLLGSQLGSWVGGRVGLLVYDVVHCFCRRDNPSNLMILKISSKGYICNEYIIHTNIPN